MSFGAPGGGAINIKPTPYVAFELLSLSNEGGRQEDGTGRIALTWELECRPERGSFPLDHDGMLYRVSSMFLSPTSRFAEDLKLGQTTDVLHSCRRMQTTHSRIPPLSAAAKRHKRSRMQIIGEGISAVPDG